MAGTAPIPTPGGARWVTVEKRKWAGQVSARWQALLTQTPPAPWLWHTPAGAVRPHPWKGREETVGCREVSVGGLDWWLVTLSVDGAGRVRACEVDAILPVERPREGVLAFVDLDLDLGLDLGRRESVLKDEEDFRRRAEEMGYPAWVRRAAWKGLWEAKRRFERELWPFGGHLEAILAAPDTDRLAGSCAPAPS